MADGLRYKDCLIVPFAEFDENSASWIPMTDISWETDGHRRSHTLTGPPYRYKNWQDAKDRMLEMAKAWIDDHPELSPSIGEGGVPSGKRHP